MDRIYTDQDASPDSLKGGTIAIVGYGSQGRAHARNLRDSGFDVVVGARPGGNAEHRAASDGFRTATPADAAGEASLLALLTPDMTHKQVYQESIAPNLRAGSALLVAHGFSIHYGEIDPKRDLDLVLVAPKGPGDLVRREYEIGRGVPCLFAVAPGRDRQGARQGAGLRPGDRRHQRRRDRNHLRAKKPRPTCSASRPCCAAASPSWSSPASTPWSRPATSPRSPISSACTS